MQNGATRIVPQRVIASFIADATYAAISTAAVYLSSLVGSAQILGVSVIALFTMQSPETPNVPASPEMNFLRWAIEQGGLVVALVTMFYFYRQAQRENAARLVELGKEHADKIALLVRDRDSDLREERDRNIAYATLLRDNTVAITKLTTAIEDAQNDRFPPRRQLGNS